MSGTSAHQDEQTVNEELFSITTGLANEATWTTQAEDDEDEDEDDEDDEEGDDDDEDFDEDEEEADETDEEE